MKFKYLLVFIFISIGILISCVAKVNIPNINREDLLILAGYIEGVIIADKFDPTNIKEISVIDTDNYSYFVKAKGNYIFDIERYGGLKIIDASDIYHPEIIKHIDTYTFYDIFIKDNYMFLAADYDGLKIYNIENIENPIEIGEFSQGRIRFVEVTDNIAYIRNISPNELILLDISQPSTPVFITKIPMTIYPSSKFILNNNYAYVADDYNGLVIFDVSDPYNPKLVSDMFWGTFVAACAYN